MSTITADGDGRKQFDGFYRYTIRDEAQRLAGDYNIKSIRSQFEQELLDLKQYNADKEKLIELIRQRIILLQGITFKDTVYLHRRKYGGDPVVYYAGVNHTPQVPDGEKHCVTYEARRFDGGPSKKEAIAKKYDAVHLTSEGQWRTRHSTPNLYGWDCESTLWLRWKFEKVEYIGEMGYMRAEA